MAINRANLKRDGVEYRICPRVNMCLHVSLYRDNELDSNTFTQNCSEHGMYIKTNGLLFPKESEIEIRYIGGKNQPIKLHAKVVHRSLNGIGISFD